MQLRESNPKAGPGVADFFKASQRSVLFGALFIILATLLAYLPAFSAGFIWDDDAYVTQNPLLTANDGLWRIWFSKHSQSQYFPLVYTTLRFEYALWGLNPVGYHAVNVCLHITNALLIWKLLRRLRLPGAWFAAAVFALHPVQVETVAWVTELKNTESTLFYLLAVSAWIHFCDGKGRWFYALTLVLHALALFAKTTACTLPAVLLLIAWLVEPSLNWRKRILQVLPFLATGFGAGVFSIWWEKHLGNYGAKYDVSMSLLEQMLLITRAFWFYISKLFWPAELTFSYPKWNINASDPWQYVWLVGCLLVPAGLWWGKKKIGLKPVAGVFFFVAVLSPMMGFIPFFTFYFSYVADHYQYLACLGIIVLFSGLMAVFFDRKQLGLHPQVGLAMPILATLGFLTWNQCHAYKNLEALWTDTLKKNPHSWMAHTNLGRLRAQQGNLSEAEMHYLEAIRLNPREDDALYNYGNLLVREKRFDEAVVQYQRALQLSPRMPDLHNNLGALLVTLKRFPEAILEFQQAIALNPNQANSYYNLGTTLIHEHKTNEAIAAFERVLNLDPHFDHAKIRLRELSQPIQ